MIFLFPKWDMLIPWRVCRCFCSDQCKIVAKKSKKHTLHLGTPENSEGSLVKVFGPKILGVFGLLPSGSHHQKKRGKAEHLCEKKPPVSYGHFCFFWGKNGSFRGFGLFFFFFPRFGGRKFCYHQKKTSTGGGVDITSISNCQMFFVFKLRIFVWADSVSALPETNIAPENRPS